MVNHSNSAGASQAKTAHWRFAVVSEHGPKSPTTVLVCLVLAVHMDAYGRNCFPSTRKIAKESKLSERSVCSHLAIAEAEGWIKRTARVTGNTWKPNLYAPTIPDTVLKELQHQEGFGTEPGGAGTEPDDILVLKEVQSSSTYNSTIKNSTKDIVENVKKVIDYLNSKCGTSYKHTTKASQGLIKARLREGFQLPDFQRVIDNKVADWGRDAKMRAFLRPQTLFGTKFEAYLNQGGGGPARAAVRSKYDNIQETFIDLGQGDGNGN